MAQDTVVQERHLDKRTVFVKNADVAVAVAGLTTILEIDDVADLVRIFVQITNDGGFAFDAFQVQGKFHTDGAYVALYSAAAAFTSPAGLIVGASGDLTTLANGTTGWFVMEVRGLKSLRLQASANGTATACDVFASAG